MDDLSAAERVGAWRISANFGSFLKMALRLLMAVAVVSRVDDLAAAVYCKSENRGQRTIFWV